MKNFNTDKKEFFKENGYVVLKNVFTEIEVETIKEEYKKVWLEMVQEGTIKQDRDQPLDSLFPPIRGYDLENDKIRELIWKLPLIQEVERLVGEEILSITTNYYYKAPGMSGMPYHQDNYAIGVSPGTCYAAWICLDMADKDRGGLRVLPGTHKLEILEQNSNPSEDFYSREITPPDNYKSLDLTTSPGDVVVYHGDLIHANTHNITSDDIRRTLVTHFMPVSSEKVFLNFNNLRNKEGQKMRKRLNNISHKFNFGEWE